MLFSVLWIPVPLVLVLGIIAYTLYQKYSPAPPMKDKVVVITGASSGLGEEFALQMSKNRNKLVLAARRLDKLKDIQQRCIDNGSEAKIVECDVAKEEDCKNLIEEANKAFGRIDVIVCNAGIGQTFFLEATNGDTSAFKQFMEINYWGCVWTTYFALPYLRKTKGRIVVLSSMGGLLPFPRQTLYNSSKHALQGFYDTLRTELGGSGVSITLANPGFIKTEMTTGASIGRDGKQMGDVAAKASAGLKMISARTGVQIILDAVNRRARSIIVPWWYSIFVYLRFFAPNLLDQLLISMFAKTRKQKE